MVNKRSFEDLRSRIILNLATGQKTVNQIAKETGINWKTVDNHLIYLIGRKYVTDVFSSEFVKIVELSDKGEELAKALKPGISIIKNKRGTFGL